MTRRANPSRAVWPALWLAALLCGGRGLAQPRPASTALPAGVARGVAFAHDRGVAGYGTPGCASSLAAVRALGATWISVTPFAFASGPAATTLRTGYAGPWGESDAAIERTIAQAHAAGLRVLLKPHVFVRGSWPGALAPRDAPTQRALLDAWAQVTMHYALLAARTHADALTVGVELDALARLRPELFRAMIARVRTLYRGTLVYAANWNSAADVSFFDAVDVVGIQAYAPLAPLHGAVTRDEAMRRAREAVARYAAFARRVGRPLWLTEVGYRADAESLREPWRWPEDAAATRCDGAMQALGLEATLAAVAREPAVTGLFIWRLFSSGGREDEGPCGFVFTGREAEGVVRAAFGGAPAAR